jgi:hypothetical protein
MGGKWNRSPMLACTDRQVCQEHLGVDVSTGKRVLVTVMNGGLPDMALRQNAFMKQLETTARWLRLMVGSLSGLEAGPGDCALGPQAAK